MPSSLAAGELTTGESEVAAVRLKASEALPAERVSAPVETPPASAAGAASEADTSGPASARIAGFGPCQGAARSQVSGSKGSAIGVVGEASESGMFARAGDPGELEMSARARELTLDELFWPLQISAPSAGAFMSRSFASARRSEAFAPCPSSRGMRSICAMRSRANRPVGDLPKQCRPSRIWSSFRSQR